jgi:3-oxoacyl-[acyl-carrier protein] reductase
MDFGLRDARVLIAGSSAGIGLATARAFRLEGASVLLTGRDANRLDAARQSLIDHGDDAAPPVETFAGDMTTTAAIGACLDHLRATWGGLDVLVANVGTGRVRADWDAGSEAWDAVLRQNLLGAVDLVRAAAPLMASGGGGTIVLVGSIAGVEVTRAPLAYGTAKAALHAFGKGLAGQLAPQAIRVNVVAPGNVLFPGGRWEEIERADPTGTARYIQNQVPMQRFGRPEEIASVIVFLAGSAASFMTGACIVVDGGQTRAF